MKSGNKRNTRLGFFILFLLIWAPYSHSVIFYDSGDPQKNTSAPTGSIASTGWHLQGKWGGFLGTPVASQFFLSAKHVGGAVGDTFEFRGVHYTTTARFDDP